MARGRPPKGLGHIDGLSGDAESKRRLRVVLQTLTGERTIEQACGELGVSEPRFHELRQRALEGAVGALLPRRPGRPPKASEPETPARLEQLQAENDELRVALQAARVRTEIALVMPHVLQDVRGKKNLWTAKAKKSKRGGKRDRPAKTTGRSGGTSDGLAR